MEELYQIFLENPCIVTDTRKIKPNSIFFALKGEHFNGNKFAAKAIEDGCKYAVIDEQEYKLNNRFVLVENVLKTLQALANYHRKKINIPIFSLTGSNGKTTTKELINVVLSSHKNCYATAGNFNNHIGVPLSLLEINKDHEVAVIEMGANHIGEIDFLCNIAEPDFGMITNIGSAHLEGFGSLEGVIQTKTEIYRHLNKKEGTVFVNKDDDRLNGLSRNIKNIKFYGKDESNFSTTRFISAEPFVKLSWNNKIIQTNLIGSYNYSNIAAAICVGEYFNIPEEKIINSLELYTPSNNRSEIVKGKNTIILDAYNANPSSMKAALENFIQMNATDKFFILGDMKELGQDSEKEHQAIIELLEKNNLKGILVGPCFKFSHTNYKTFETREESTPYINELNLNENLILIKGSRGIKLEPLADILK